jgi:hypothetical protein
VNRPRRPRGDAGVFVIGTLAKLMIFLAIVGVIGYDTVAITTTQLAVRDDAQQAALLGHTALRDKGTVQAAYAAVLKFAEENGDTVVRGGFATGPNHTVTVRLRREAHTIVASMIPRVKTYVVADTTASVSDPSL